MLDIFNLRAFTDMYFRGPIRPVLILTVLLMSACSNTETEKLRAENDSLRSELTNHHSMALIMHDVKNILDSIDANRELLHIELIEGTTHESVTKRLSVINGDVKKTAERLASLERELKVSRHNNSAYLMMVEALQGELQTRIKQVGSLERTMNKYRSLNTGLSKTVKLQQDELTAMLSKIDTKQQELSLLQARVDELVKNFEVTEAEAYYARARSVEEVARLTRLAPQKKRETYLESLELYKKAFSLGKDEARINIETIEKKLHR